MIGADYILVMFNVAADVNKDGKLQWRDFELARDVSYAVSDAMLAR